MDDLSSVNGHVDSASGAAGSHVPTQPAPRAPPPSVAPRPARPHSISGPPVHSSGARGQPAKRGRPVITVVEAKPMSQVGFRDTSSGGPPASPRQSSRPEITVVGARPMSEVGFREGAAAGPVSPAGQDAAAASNSDPEDLRQTEVKTRGPPSRPKVPPVRPPSIRHSMGPAQQLPVGEPPPPYDDKPLPSYEDVLHETISKNPASVLRPPKPSVDRSARSTSMYASLPPPRPAPRPAARDGSPGDDNPAVGGGGASRPPPPPVRPKARPQSLLGDGSGASESELVVPKKPMGIRVLPVLTPKDAQPSEVAKAVLQETNGEDATVARPVPSPRPKPSPRAARKPALPVPDEQPQQSVASDGIPSDWVPVLPATVKTSGNGLEDSGDVIVRSESEASGPAVNDKGGAVTKKRPTIIRPNRMKKSVSQDLNSVLTSDKSHSGAPSEQDGMKNSDSVPSIPTATSEQTSSTPPGIRKQRPTIIRARKTVSMMELGGTKSVASDEMDNQPPHDRGSEVSGNVPDMSKNDAVGPPLMGTRPSVIHPSKTDTVITKQGAEQPVPSSEAPDHMQHALQNISDSSTGLEESSTKPKNTYANHEAANEPRNHEPVQPVVSVPASNVKVSSIGQSDLGRPSSDKSKPVSGPPTHPKPPPPVKPKPATKPKPAVAVKPKPATLPKKPKSVQGVSAASNAMPVNSAMNTSKETTLESQKSVDGSDGLKELKENIINEEKEAVKVTKRVPPPVQARPPSLYSIISNRKSLDHDEQKPPDSGENVQNIGMKKSHTFPITTNGDSNVSVQPSSVGLGVTVHSSQQDVSAHSGTSHPSHVMSTATDDSFDVLCSKDGDAAVCEADQPHHKGSTTAIASVEGSKPEVQLFHASNEGPPPIPDSSPAAAISGPSASDTISAGWLPSSSQSRLSGQESRHSHRQSPPPVPPHSPKLRQSPPPVPHHSQEYRQSPPPVPSHSPRHRPSPPPVPPHSKQRQSFPPHIPGEIQSPPPVPSHSPNQKHFPPSVPHHSPERQKSPSPPPPPVGPRQHSLSSENVDAVSPPPVASRRPQPLPQPVPSHRQKPPPVPAHSTHSESSPSGPPPLDDGPPPPLPSRNPVMHSSMSELPTQSPVTGQFPVSSVSLHNMADLNTLSDETAGRSERTASLGAFDLDILEGKSQMPIDLGARSAADGQDSVTDDVPKHPGKPPRAPPPAVRTSKVEESASLGESVDVKSLPPPKPAGPSRPPGPSKPPPPRPKSQAPVDQPPAESASMDRQKSVRPSRPGPPPPAAAARKSKSNKPPPRLPRRPTPGHPLFHYVVQGPHGIALFDFDASQGDELSFKAGDVILLNHYISDDWLHGRNVDQQGMFPANFVDVVEPPPHSAAKESAGVPVASARAARVSREEGSGPRCRARFDFEGESEGDLSFSSGDLIQLVEQAGDEWLIGEINGRRGMFPVAFVEIIEELPAGSQAASGGGERGLDVPDLHASGASSHIQEHDTKDEAYCIALYDFTGEEAEDLSFSAGDRITLISHMNAEWLRGSLHGREGCFPAAYVEIKQDVKDDQPPPAGANPPPLAAVQLDQPTPLAKAVYDFTGEAAGDLSFKVGQLIVLTDRIDADWLKGDLDGIQGIFPAAFVEIIQPLPEEDA